MLAANKFFLLAALTIGVFVAGDSVQAQPAAPAEPMVQLNFPQEVEVQVLIDYVSNRLGVKFLEKKKELTERACFVMLNRHFDIFGQSPRDSGNTDQS